MNASGGFTIPGWPRYLSRDEAARYVGVSVSTFDQEVAAGQWPRARQRGLKATRLTWDRVLLDAYADQVAGLGLPAEPAASDPLALSIASAGLAEAEAAALRGIADAKTKHRPKHRQQKAA